MSNHQQPCRCADCIDKENRLVQPGRCNHEDPDGMLLFGARTSIGHLSSLVDALRVALKRSIDAMSALHKASEPDETPDMNAVVPAHAFRTFVDEHAALLHAWATWGAPPDNVEGVHAEASVSIDFKQATDLLDMFGGESGEVALKFGNGHSGLGLYAFYPDYPDEGTNYLGLCDDEALPESDKTEQGAEAVRMLTVVRHFVENVCEKPLTLEAVLNVIDLGIQEARGLARGEFVQMVREDANAHCEILSLLGMEEEGDAVAAVSELIAGNARYVFMRTNADKSKATGDALDAECDAGIADAVAQIARAMYPGTPS